MVLACNMWGILPAGKVPNKGALLGLLNALPTASTQLVPVAGTHQVHLVKMPNAAHRAKLLANWQVPTIATARLTQHQVVVNGIIFTSFKQAQLALLGACLPNWKKLRLALKANGTLTAGGLTFTI